MLVSKEVQVPEELMMLKYTKNDDHKDEGRGKEIRGIEWESCGILLEKSTSLRTFLKDCANKMNLEDEGKKDRN